MRLIIDRIPAYEICHMTKYEVFNMIGIGCLYRLFNTVYVAMIIQSIEYDYIPTITMPKEFGGCALDLGLDQSF